MRRKPIKRRVYLDGEGRLRIPRSVLKKAGLKPGQTAELEVAYGGIVVRRPAPKGLLWERGLLVSGSIPLEDPLEAMARMRKEDLEREIRRCWPS